MDNEEGIAPETGDKLKGRHCERTPSKRKTQLLFSYLKCIRKEFQTHFAFKAFGNHVNETYRYFPVLVYTLYIVDIDRS